MTTLTYIITNSGDGSNYLIWTDSEEVITKLEERADDGDEWLASGDGLQAKTLKFANEQEKINFIELNRIHMYSDE